MQKFSISVISICAFLMSVLFPGNARSQKPESLLNFYESEQQSWREYIDKFEAFAGNSNYDVTFYYLNVEINIPSPFISGNVLCRFSATENNVQSIKLNLQHSLIIDSIAGNAGNYTVSGDSIFVTLNRPFQTADSGHIRVFYHGIPQLAGGLKGLRYTVHGNSEPIIATLSTPFLAHYWWPCKDGPGDKPDSVYVDITIADITVNGIPVVAVSNGVLENTITQHGKKTFQWRHRYPIVPYYVMAAISNYRLYQQTYNGNFGGTFPLDYYVFNEHLGSAQAGVAQLPQAIELFSDLFTPYPFQTEKYGMTQLGFYGAIENQTNTIINNMSLSNFDVAVHELSHMWFGDMITCANWHHGWLNEGFATYCEALWAEHLGGFAAYKNNMMSNQYFGSGTLYLQNISDPFQIFIGIIYQKGAYVLHMLRGVLGDSLFFESLYRYASNPAFRYGEATTEDFQGVCETVSGMDLDFFFEQWIYDQNYPAYQYSFSQNPASFQATVRIQQIQASYGAGWRPVFGMPVQLKFNYLNGSDTLVTVWNDQQDQSFAIDLAAQIGSMEFDPDRWILRTAQYVVGIANEPFHHLPADYSIGQNYPNPFNPETSIRFSIPQAEHVKITVYNILGEEKAELLDQRISAGTHIVKFDGRGLASGIYFYEFQAGNFMTVRKMLLAK